MRIFQHYQNAVVFLLTWFPYKLLRPSVFQSNHWRKERVPQIQNSLTFFMRSFQQQIALLLFISTEMVAAASVSTPEVPPKIIITLSDTQSAIVAGIGGLTFLILALVLFDQLAFTRDYQQRHGILLERMTNIIHTRLPLTPASVPLTTTYYSVSPSADCPAPFPTGRQDHLKNP